MADAGQKLRITFVIPYFYPAWEYGGQPRSAFELAKALVSRGHIVKVLTTDSGGHSRLEESETTGRRDVEGIETIYYRNLSNRLAFRYRLFLPIRMFREIANEIRGSDIVHIHELRSTVSVLAYRAARRLKIPYVLSGHGGLRRLGRVAAKSVYDKFWGQDILRDAAGVIAISSIEEADAGSMGVEAKRIHALSNIIRAEDFADLPQLGAFRKRWSLPSGKIILFLGRLHPIKGTDLLVQAFARINQKEPGACLVIAGPDDGQEQELRREVSRLNLDSRVKFTGFLDLQSKKEAFVDASVVVLPSRSEVFALTAVEALLCGTPVLLSSACGISAVSAVANAAAFFSNEDVVDLTAKLLAVLKDDHYLKAARSLQPTVGQVFNPDAVGLEAERIYRSVINDSKGNW